MTGPDLLLKQLQARNPVPLDAVRGRADGTEAEQLLHRILATPPESATNSVTSTTSARPTRSRVLAVAAALVATVGITLGALTLPSSSTSSAYAATPPMIVPNPAGAPPARPLLLRLADTAARQPDAYGAGRYDYDYIAIQEWALSSAVTRSSTTSAVVPTLLQRWTSADGHGRVREQTGYAEVQRVGNRQTLQAVITGQGKSSDLRLGEHGNPPAPRIDLSALSTNPAVLARQLLTNRGGLSYDLDTSGDPISGQRLRNILQLHRQQVIPPALDAAMLRVLAATPGIVDLGAVTDRVGRRGVAVSLDYTWGRPQRAVLIFNPTTGKLLGDETIVTTVYQPGKPEPLNVRIPAVVDYFAYLHAGHVATTDATVPSAH